MSAHVLLGSVLPILAKLSAVGAHVGSTVQRVSWRSRLSLSPCVSQVLEGIQRTSGFIQLFDFLK